MTYIESLKSGHIAVWDPCWMALDPEDLVLGYSKLNSNQKQCISIANEIADQYAVNAINLRS